MHPPSAAKQARTRFLPSVLPLCGFGYPICSEDLCTRLLGSAPLAILTMLGFVIEGKLAARMDPRQLFVDDRMTGACVFCGGAPETRDHVPSRVLLDDPLPENLPVVGCCESCNSGFSLDEQYVACFIDCVLAGSASPQRVARPKVSRILAETPALAARIAAAAFHKEGGQQGWQPEIERVQTLVLKLARGHVAYELSLLQLEEPLSIACIPLVTMNESLVTEFLSSKATPFWPEIGSRAFIRACRQFPDVDADSWQIVQPGRYQYLVSQAEGLFVRILLSDYLACEVRWE
jgi:hypothetical protein